MAKVGFGPNITDARGSTADVTYTRTRAGQIMRARVAPSQPASAARAAIQAARSAMLTRWSTVLDDDKRRAWDVFGQNFPTNTPIAGSHPLTGHQAYLRCNIMLQWDGDTILDDPPPDQNVTQLLGLGIDTLTASPQAFDVSWAPDPGANEYIIVSASPPVSAGARACFSKMRIITLFDSGSPSPQSIISPYTAAWGTLPLGMRVGVIAKFWRTTNGAFSRPMQLSAIVS